jgi:hypothetical protein
VKAQCKRLTSNEHLGRLGRDGVEGASVSGGVSEGASVSRGRDGVGGTVRSGRDGVEGASVSGGVAEGASVSRGRDGLGGTVTDMASWSSLDQKDSSSTTSTLFPAVEPPMMRSKASTRVVAFMRTMVLILL